MSSHRGRRVLIIAPHMDDEVLGVGGTIVRHVEAGDQVSVVVCANRAYGHRYDAGAIKREKGDAERARRILGYKNLRFLDLPDERLDRELAEIIIPLEKVYAELKPDTVYIPHRGDVNQDHRAVFQAALVVCRPLGDSAPLRVYSFEAPSSTDQAPPFPEWVFMPNRYVPLSDAQLARKSRALACYERELRAFPHPRSAAGVLAYAAKRGMEIGRKAAEAFVILREVTE